ncbi:sulfite exporter TauE/SafE family protein [Cognatiyoonia koreensis]|uniref:sulfite exporter TauE/SafE family protein n=1 Tax=Cognatiyoonia koreensis TaxID=364200 RepID=UPI001F60B213|nr:sulfite exporter TauE/SafE family protein [Cognatiyoonia koreensis]
MAIVAAVCVGLGKGGVPVITALAVPLMSLVMSPIVAAGLLLPVFIAADVFGLIAYRKSFSRDVLKIVMVAMPLGVLIGYLTVDYVSDAMVVLILGLIGAIFALSLMLRKPVETPPRPARWGSGLFWGTITGFTSFVSHSGSVPYQIYVLPLKLEKIIFAGTVTVAFAYINIIKLVPYYLLGQLNLANMKTAAILMIPAAVSVFAGVWLIRVMPEKLFFRIIVWALLALSLKLLYDGIMGLYAP